MRGTNLNFVARSPRTLADCRRDRQTDRQTDRYNEGILGLRRRIKQSKLTSGSCTGFHPLHHLYHVIQQQGTDIRFLISVSVVYSCRRSALLHRAGNHQFKVK